MVVLGVSINENDPALARSFKFEVCSLWFVVVVLLQTKDGPFDKLRTGSFVKLRAGVLPQIEDGHVTCPAVFTLSVSGVKVFLIKSYYRFKSRPTQDKVFVLKRRMDIKLLVLVTAAKKKYS